MNFIKQNWILLLILVILIIVIVKMNKKPATTAAAALSSGSGIFSGISTPRPVVSSPSVINSSANPPYTGGPPSQNLKIGDDIYAGDSIVNAYTSPNAISGTTQYYFKKDDLIGTYLSKEGGFYKVSIDQGLFSGYGNYFVLANQVYSK